MQRTYQELFEELQQDHPCHPAWFIEQYLSERGHVKPVEELASSNSVLESPEPRPAPGISTSRDFGAPIVSAKIRNRPGFDRGQQVRAEIRAILERHPAIAPPLIAKQIKPLLSRPLGVRQIQTHMARIRSGK